jgi:hypothetical protein
MISRTFKTGSSSNQPTSSSTSSRRQRDGSQVNQELCRAKGRFLVLPNTCGACSCTTTASNFDSHQRPSPLAKQQAASKYPLKLADRPNLRATACASGNQRKNYWTHSFTSLKVEQKPQNVGSSRRKVQTTAEVFAQDPRV